MPYKTFALLCLLVGSVACDRNDITDHPIDPNAPDARPVADANPNAPDANPNAPDANPNQPDAMPGTPDAAAASAEAMAFCTDYENECGYGGNNRFQSENECLMSYDSFDATRQMCVESQIDMIQSGGNPNQLCPRAAGNGPCS